MNEKVVGVLSSLLKEDATVLAEKIQANDEEYLNTLEAKSKDLKVFTNDEFISITNNLKSSFKDSVYKEVKGTTLEMLEKNVKKSYGYDTLKQGADYGTVEQLLDKIITTEKSKGSNNESLTKELDLLRNALKTKTEEVEQIKLESDTKVLRELADVKLSGAIQTLKDKLDVQDTLKDVQLRMFKSGFLNDYDINKDDNGNFVVYSKDKGELIRKDDYSPMSIEDVVNNVANKMLPIKNKVPKAGRSEEYSADNNNTLNYKKFATWGDFLKSEHGKGLIAGTIAHDTHYKEWRKFNN